MPEVQEAFRKRMDRGTYLQTLQELRRLEAGAYNQRPQHAGLAPHNAFNV